MEQIRNFSTNFHEFPKVKFHEKQACGSCAEKCGQTDGQTEGQTDITKLLDACYDYVNELKMAGCERGGSLEKLLRCINSYL
jgi:hypothetical protein